MITKEGIGEQILVRHSKFTPVFILFLLLLSSFVYIPKVFAVDYSLTMYTVGEGSVLPGNGTYVSGVSVDLEAFNAVGWTFQGWSGGAAGSSNTTIVISGDTVVNATFVQSISVDIVLGSSGVTMQYTFNFGTTWTAPYQIIISGATKTFSSWSDGSTDPVRVFTTSGTYTAIYI